MSTISLIPTSTTSATCLKPTETFDHIYYPNDGATAIDFRQSIFFRTPHDIVGSSG